MTDREKVIKGLECCIESDDEACPKECPFYKECLTDDMPYMPAIRAALELLKEQESEKVLNAKDRSIINETHGKTGFCPRCNQVVVWEINRRYCGFCGKELKLDD
jgi:NADH pyrophosphatase NudC (nudix superfamily)